MKEGKLRILFYNQDQAGVNYFRTLTPAMEMERNHSDEFHVEINPQINFDDPETVNYLKSFDVIHYHRQFVNDTMKMMKLKKELKNVTFIMDIDDYWQLHKGHPLYQIAIQHEMHKPILENLKLADYVTTTTEYFANKIKEITKKDNVFVLPNSVDPTWMKQFKNNWKPDPDGKVRITYMAGSCYDDQTEILTENGFKLFQNLDKNEKVATLNPKTNKIEYQKPTDYTDEEYDGQFYYGKNDDVDFAVTPNHNMYVNLSNKMKTGDRHFLVKMMDLLNYDLKFKRDCKWEDGSLSEIKKIPVKLIGNEKISIKKTLELITAFICFGKLVGDDKIIFNFKNNKISELNNFQYVYEMFFIIEKMDLVKYIDFSNYILHIHNKKLHDYLKNNIVNYKNTILNLPQKELTCFFEKFIELVGKKLKKQNKYIIKTKEKNVVNFVNELALKIGKSCNFNLKNEKFFKFFKIPNSEFYEVIVHENNTPVITNSEFKMSNYKGRIYCVTVPNHIIFVRRNGRSYWCGNSHKGDVELLQGVFNVLGNDTSTKDKFKIILGGWDAEGNTTEIRFNQELGKVLQMSGYWNREVIDILNKTKGNIDAVPNIPNEIKEKYRNNVFISNKRDIKSEESIYYYYENILTDNHNIIKNNDYKKWLMNFERNVKYENEDGYGRRWTQKANMYATTLDETDIVLAPLQENDFNKAKSNLKQVECWTRKIPPVCSDVIPYNVHGKHMENCILIPNKKNQMKYWVKYLKKLILDSNLRKDIGNQLYEDFKEKFHLKNVTQKRVEIYKNVLNKKF